MRTQAVTMKSWHVFVARFARLAMVIPLLLVAACAGTPPPAGSAPIAGEAGVESYTLGTGDKLRITVFNEPNLSGEFDIDSAGIVALPLVGNVKAAGITQRDLEQQITARLAGGYMRDPRVNVEVLIYRPFYILGEVSRPGEYPYRNGMNVMGAIAVAGGFTYRGNDKTIYIRRAGQTDERSYPVTTTTVVLPGDILRVPERMF